MTHTSNFRIWNYFQVSLWLLLLISLLAFDSCSHKPEPYSVVEVTGSGNVTNYSKSFYLMQSVSDSINHPAILATKGDMIISDEYVYIYDDTSQKRLEFDYHDSLLYVNNKITTVDIPGNNEMVKWFPDLKKEDLAELQFISFSSKIPESYLPFLTELSEIKPDAGLYYNGDFKDLTSLLKIFKPRYIVGPSLTQSDFDQLSGLTALEILTVTLEDSIINDPLPPVPGLKQIILSEIEKDAVLTNDLFKNNPQLEKVIINRSGSLDIAMLNPLINLKELFIFGADNIENPNLISNHNKLEMLTITGDDLVYDPASIRLPALRWMSFSSNVTQDEFNTFISSHPDLEVVGLISNDSIKNLDLLKKLNKLTGLMVTDTITDISLIKTLTNLNYLSLPDGFLKKPGNRAEIQKSLPATRITANEGFCLGSGWILLLLPLILIIRIFIREEKQRFPSGNKY